MATDSIPNQLARLTRVRPRDDQWIVSCYLKLEPRDRARGKYLIKLKNRIKEVEQSLSGLELDRAAADTIMRDLHRVQDYLRDPSHLPSTQGLALFASEPRDLFEAVPLPKVYRSRLGVDRTPLVRELASVEDEFGRLLTVVLDRTAARFFAVTAFGIEELTSLRADSTRGKRFRGERQGGISQGAVVAFGEHTYHNRIREEKHRHYEEIARQLFELHRKAPADGIVLAGSGAEGGKVEPFLHPYVAERIMGVAKLNPKDVTPARVHQATLEVREAFERASEREVTRELEEQLGSGWAVNGMTATVRALARGQVRTLLVHADSAAPGFRCEASGRLALSERECRGEGRPIPVLDLVDEAIEEALRQRVTVDVVYDAEATRAIDGLAGLLRFR